ISSSYASGSVLIAHEFSGSGPNTKFYAVSPLTITVDNTVQTPNTLTLRNNGTPFLWTDNAQFNGQVSASSFSGASLTGSLQGTASAAVTSSLAKTSSYVKTSLSNYMDSTNLNASYINADSQLTVGSTGTTIDDNGNAIFKGVVSSSQWFQGIQSAVGFVGTSSWAVNSSTASFVSQNQPVVTLLTGSNNGITASFTGSANQQVNI